MPGPPPQPVDLFRGLQWGRQKASGNLNHVSVSLVPIRPYPVPWCKAPILWEELNGMLPPDRHYHFNTGTSHLSHRHSLIPGLTYARTLGFRIRPRQTPSKSEDRQLSGPIRRWASHGRMDSDTLSDWLESRRATRRTGRPTRGPHPMTRLQSTQ